MEEIRIIEGWDDYGITRDGRVWSYKTKKWKKCGANQKGYLQITLQQNGRIYQPYVHRLVFETWVRKLQPNEEVHHINHIRDDNRVENLEAIDSVLHKKDPETRRRMSLAKKGKPSPKKGRKSSPEAIAKMV